MGTFLVLFFVKHLLPKQMRDRLTPPREWPIARSTISLLTGYDTLHQNGVFIQDSITGVIIQVSR